MRTVTVQIGNSDGKLNQAQWSNFAEKVRLIIEKHAEIVHFSGCSHGLAKWQNAAWVFDCHEDDVDLIKEYLSFEKGMYRQDSIAWTEGETFFI
jgi:hypothetical protein